MNRILLLLAVLLVALPGLSQKYWTKNGHIRFFSEAPLENIEADNHQVSSILDLETDELVFSLLMTAFEFEKALMQEHFNEKYVESATYPKATFEGTVDGLDALDPAEPGEHAVTVSGDLTIHGVTNPVETTGTFTVLDDGTIDGDAVFTILLADYDIEVPAVVRDNIAREIEIFVDMNYELYGN